MLLPCVLALGLCVVDAPDVTHQETIKVPTETGHTPLRHLSQVLIEVGDADELDFDRNEVLQAVRHRLRECGGPREVTLQPSGRPPMLYVAIDAKRQGALVAVAVTLEVLEPIEIARIPGLQLDAATWQHVEVGTVADGHTTARIKNLTVNAVNVFLESHATANGQPRPVCAGL
jgi:hypothetical protein